MRYVFSLICLFLTISPVVKAQQMVTGQITDGTDGMPVPGVAIFIANTSIGTSYDEYGNYSITAPGVGSFDLETVQVNIESPLYLACVSEPVTDRMIENTYNTIFGGNATFPVSILMPQQITIYSDGTYTGLMEVQEYRNSIIGLSSVLPVEYAATVGKATGFDDIVTHKTTDDFRNSNENKVSGQDLDGELSKLIPFIRALNEFAKNIPQEKVYLHFDNTSYYQGDNIWFKCYVVTSGQHQLSHWSKTLYVELLNPGGEIVDKRTLK
ncbi:MAG: carboxypeptidase-like regulatory domain-containing protein, partial [Tannerella sp.]|nr:carboxypeptidase-like regulatory domain-containing protein [Tannerella sp.]